MKDPSEHVHICVLALDPSQTADAQERWLRELGHVFVDNNVVGLEIAHKCGGTHCRVNQVLWHYSVSK